MPEMSSRVGGAYAIMAEVMGGIEVVGFRRRDVIFIFLVEMVCGTVVGEVFGCPYTLGPGGIMAV